MSLHNASMNEREIQFHAGLLVVGEPPGRLRNCLKFGGQDVTRFNYAAFKLHKSKLLAYLEAADYFDVYYPAPGKRDDPHVHQVLTEKAAVWIGEFYQWILAAQERGE